MSLRDNSIDSKILENAKTEFMEKGFKKASLREICKRAGVTTGALYNRFSGKDDLFKALVKPTLDDIEDLTNYIKEYNYAYLDKGEMQTVWDMSEDTHKKWIDFFYDRYDGMKLLLCCGEGSKYSDFLHDFVQKNTKQTYEFMQEVKRREISINNLDVDELHILLTSYWSAVFETIIHDFSREKALRYCSNIVKFFNWQNVLGI
jgi:AcrR family transcriptional regulator